jgi:hypothetical protein
MKKVLMVLFVGIISLGLITGCSKTKEKINAEDFYNKVGSDYKLQDRTSQIGYANKAYVYEDSNIYFYYYEGKRSFDMGNIYIDEVNGAASSLFNVEQDIDKGDNYSSIKMHNEETYIRVTYVDNTLLYGKTSIENKKLIDEVFDRCGY